MTSDAKKLLFLMYCAYKNRRSNGKARQDAVLFGSYTDVAELMPDDLPDDVDDYIRELDRLGFVGVQYGDDHVYECWLKSSAIAKMEQLPLDYLRSVADFILRFIP